MNGPPDRFDSKPANSIIVTAVTGLAVCVGLLFFLVMFGSTFGSFIAVAFGIFGMFWIHYRLWGRAMEATPPEDEGSDDA